MADSQARPTSSSTLNGLMHDVSGVFSPSTASGVDVIPPVEDTIAISLSQALYARRAEYVQARHVRIKVGTWNVAGIEETVGDIAGWFVQGRGVSEALAGLQVQDQNELHGNRDIPSEEALEGRENVGEQEARYDRRSSTLPRNDPGSLPGDDDIGLYMLGLQEIVNINSATEALRPYTDPTPANRWKDNILKALPVGYSLVVERQLTGLLLLIFASQEIASSIRSVSTASVGTGLGGVMGNKGAVAARIVLGDTTRIVFVNCHLAAGADKTALDRRNRDAAKIISQARFQPIKDSMDLQQSTGEQIGDEDFAFWTGDLNYRLEGIHGDDVRRLLMLHTRNEYDLSHKSARKIEEQLAEVTASVRTRAQRASISSMESQSSPSIATSGNAVDSTISLSTPLQDEIEASEDPMSLQTTLSSLLPHDELHQQMKARKAFHDGWEEGPITFLPTYKYDVGSVGVFDSSEKKRAPSWCDRILYRTRRGRLAYESVIRDEETARQKDDEMKSKGIDQAARDEEILYDYDPDQDGDAEYHDEYDEYDERNDDLVITKEGFEDELHLEYYTAHQRVLSSDHKPLDAIFTLQYDAVVPDLKAKVHAEVVKEFDKAENEARPNVTVVVDKHGQDDVESNDFEGVYFGDIRWSQTTARTITLANTGRVPATFSFVERPEAEAQTGSVAPAWLGVRLHDEVISNSAPATPPVTLEPGDAYNVELEVRVFDVQTAQRLNDGPRLLEDVLVLRVDGGRDHFIPLRANWLVTCLGHPIDKLIRIPEGGIRQLQAQVAQSQDTPSACPFALENYAEQFPIRFSAPRELLKLTEAVEDLTTRVVAEWEMLHPEATSDVRTSLESEPALPPAPWVETLGWPFSESAWTERNTLQFQSGLGDAMNALDTDQPLSTSLAPDIPQIQKLYVMVCLLQLFIGNLPDGIINASLWDQIDTALSRQQKSKIDLDDEEQRIAIQELLSQAPSHSISFVLVMAMLERVLQDTTRVASEFVGNGNAVGAPTSPVRKAEAKLRRLTASGRLPADSPGAMSENSRRVIIRIYADLVIRSQLSAGEKNRNVQDQRRLEVVGTFVRRPIREG